MLRWNRRAPWLQKKKRNTKDQVIYSRAMRWQWALSHTNQYRVSKLISCKRTFMTRISRIFKAIDKARPWQAAANTIAAFDWPPSQSSAQIIHGKKSYNAHFTLVQGNVAKQVSAFVKPVLAIKGDPFLVSPFAGRMNNSKYTSLPRNNPESLASLYCKTLWEIRVACLIQGHTKSLFHGFRMNNRCFSMCYYDFYWLSLTAVITQQGQLLSFLSKPQS